MIFITPGQTQRGYYFSSRFRRDVLHGRSLEHGVGQGNGATGQGFQAGATKPHFHDRAVNVVDHDAVVQGKWSVRENREATE